jgi:hypothetical protein
MILALGIAIGVTVGWLVPQPQWAKDLFVKVRGWFS